MKISYEKNNNELTITQRYYNKLLVTFLGISGIILFIICLMLIPVKISESISSGIFSLKIFDNSLLILHFLFTLAAAMIFVRYSKESVAGYSENVVFSKKDSAIKLYNAALGDIPYIIPYSRIAFLRTYKKSGGPDIPDFYSIEAVKKDKASFWITGFASDPAELIKLTNEIASYTGFPVNDSADIGTGINGTAEYAAQGEPVMQKKSRFIEHNAVNGDEIIKLKNRKTAFINKLTASVIYLFFFSIPLYIFNIFITDSIPAIVHFFTILFIILWNGILLAVIAVSLKNYKIIINHGTLHITVTLKLLPLIKFTIDIPGSFISTVRTNRIEYGTICLTLGVSKNLKLNNKSGTKFMNLSLYRSYRPSDLPDENEYAINLWEIPAGNKPGMGPDIFDLEYIEYTIQNNLSIKEL